MKFDTKRFSQSNTLPVTLATLKAHVRIEYADDDTQLTKILNWAIDQVQRDCNQVFIEGVYDLYIPRLARKITLPRRTASVSSVKYYDSENELQTLTVDEDWSTYLPDRSYGQLQIKLDEFPETYCRPDAVVIRFTTDGTNIPPRFEAAVCIKAGEYNENREGSDKPNLTYERLIDGLRTGEYI